MSGVSTIAIVAVLATTSSFSASSIEASVASVSRDPNSLEEWSEVSRPLSIEDQAFYRARSERLEALKAEIYMCIYSIEYDQSLWDLLVEEELPYRAFARLAKRSDLLETFRDHPSLVVTDRDGRMRLTRDAMCAWARIHAELSA